MTVKTGGGIPGFDPFSQRVDRDVRNALGKALVSALLQSTPQAIDACALTWQRAPLPKTCRTYLTDRLSDYRAVMASIRPGASAGAECIALTLWNRGLFFECHEWLENFWHRARPPRRQALQGWIMAAGAFSLLESARRAPARCLARKAAARLGAAGRCLETIENLEDLIHGLAQDPPVAAVLRVKC